MAREELRKVGVEPITDEQNKKRVKKKRGKKESLVNPKQTTQPQEKNRTKESRIYLRFFSRQKLGF